MNKFVDRLNNIFTSANVCKSHGIDHAIAVMAHADLAIKSKNYKISNRLKDAVKLAALLHDADDRKFFPAHKKYENLKLVLHDKPSSFVDLVVRMVSLVSSAANADRIPPDAVGKEWMLIPRYADRVEALGIIGVERCFQYNKTKQRPMYVESTLKAKSEEEIFQIATEERYNAYVGNSNSMIDHYYDKLLRISNVPIDNNYLVQLARERQQVTIRFILYFGSLEAMSEKDVDQFIENEKLNQLNQLK